jgi:hypothetical protein
VADSAVWTVVSEDFAMLGSTMLYAPWQVPDLWTCPVNPHPMNNSFNIIFILMYALSAAALPWDCVGSKQSLSAAPRA